MREYIDALRSYMSKDYREMYRENPPFFTIDISERPKTIPTGKATLIGFMEAHL